MTGAVPPRAAPRIPSALALALFGFAGGMLALRGLFILLPGSVMPAVVAASRLGLLSIGSLVVWIALAEGARRRGVASWRLVPAFVLVSLLPFVLLGVPWPSSGLRVALAAVAANPLVRAATDVATPAAAAVAVGVTLAAAGARPRGGVLAALVAFPVVSVLPLWVPRLVPAVAEQLEAGGGAGFFFYTHLSLVASVLLVLVLRVAHRHAGAPSPWWSRAAVGLALAGGVLVLGVLALAVWHVDAIEWDGLTLLQLRVRALGGLLVEVGVLAGAVALARASADDGGAPVRRSADA